jgi:DNA invertase Pin-like site-specific DNA recombinase
LREARGERGGQFVKAAALYARVSTRDKGQETENQLAELREFAAKQEWEIVSEFVDRESGSTSERPEFQAMFTAASQRKFDILLFWSLDRLSREGVLETLQHLNRLTSYGVNYRSFTERYFDSCGIFKDAVISILATIARQERIRISERVRAGMKIARAKGRNIGRPRAVVDVAQIGQLSALGTPWAKIGRTLGVSARTVKRVALRAAGSV